MRRVRRCALALVLAAAATGCSIETAGAPTGDVTLYATFEDVQDLTPGHNVQASNVVVGSVREITLDGYEARVRMSIVDDFQVPEGTAAVVQRTSLLGEYYVDLVLPEDLDPDAATFLASGDEIDDATTQPDVEQLAEQAATVVGALTADDIGSTVAAAAEGLGGRGPVLNQLVRDAALVADALADQQAQIAATIDRMATLGSTLAPASGELATTIDQLAAATGTIAEGRDRMVAAVDALVELATLTNDTVIEPHADRLATLLEQVRPLLGSLADQGDILATLIVDLGRFVEVFPTAVHDGTVLMLAWLYPDVGSLLGQGTGDSPLEALTGLLGARP